MNPVLLQKQLRDNSKDLQDFYKELHEWGDDMKRKDESCKSGTTNDSEAAPLPRSKVQKTEHIKESDREPKYLETKKPKRIKSCDYKAWEKFNADAYCESIDKEGVGEELSDDASDDLSDELDVGMVDLANCEKEKGNAFVKKQRWDDAIKSYTKAIECYAYDPIFYANRALCHLKTQNYRNAESDCTTAIQLDKKYVKAYQRRAAARESLNQLNEARDDLLRVLELEKKNTESKAALVKLEKKMEVLKQPVAEPHRPVSKFTLSRQKQRPLPAAEVADNKNQEILALKTHVVEKVAPEATSSKSEEIIPKKVEKVEPSLPVTYKDWPSGDNVELFVSLPKPRKPRSAKLLQRVAITDVDLITELQECDQKTNHILELDKNQSKMQVTVEKREEETLNLLEQITQRTKQIFSTPKIKAGDIARTQEQLELQIPKTSVQFYRAWKTISANQDFRYHYMKQIDTRELSDIFKESLESKVFSELIETLTATRERDLIYGWLKHLVNVKRFSALTMFMSATDKKRISDLISYLKEDNKFHDVEDLGKKYEL